LSKGRPSAALLPNIALYFYPMQAFETRIERVEELDRLAERLLALMPRGVWALRGTLGAGKTALVRAVCKQLGVRDGVGSPSFGLIHEYRDAESKPVYHLDWYRLDSAAAVFELGVDELFESGALCLVEWPERAEEALPEHRLEVRIELEEAGADSARIFTVYRL